MKIRFKKILGVDEHCTSDNRKVTFQSCDQVQVKLTHMEMNSACLRTCCNAVGKLRIEVFMTSCL
jgi:hypothetical protein